MANFDRGRKTLTHEAAVGGMLFYDGVYMGDIIDVVIEQEPAVDGVPDGTPVRQNYDVTLTFATPDPEREGYEEYQRTHGEAALGEVP